MDMWCFENQFRDAGYQRIAGVDEVGRGPYAGPVVAAAVILPHQLDLPGLNDSKKLTAKKREALATALEQHPEVHIGLAEISPAQIDEINILQATWLAMRQAVENLPLKADFILVDGKPVKGLPVDSENLIKGDGRSASIAAASIIAKVYRDRLMCELDQSFPEYGFASNMGYGTKAHQQALEQFGATIHHRRSFAPVAKVLGLAPPVKKTAKPKKKAKSAKKPTVDPNQPELF